MSKQRELEDLYQRLSLLRDEIDRLRREARSWAEKRDAIHEKIRRIKSSIQELRQRRDALNLEVKRLKALREDGLKRRSEIIEEIRRLTEERRRMRGDKPRRSRSSLESQLERIEWRIQTEPLSLEEERRLIDQIRLLESQLEYYRRA